MSALTIVGWFIGGFWFGYALACVMCVGSADDDHEQQARRSRQISL